MPIQKEHAYGRIPFIRRLIMIKLISFYFAICGGYFISPIAPSWQWENLHTNGDFSNLYISLKASGAHLSLAHFQPINRAHFPIYNHMSKK